MSSRIHHSTDADFDAEVLQAEGKVLVDFWAPWCGPCVRLGPVMESLAAERGEGLKVVKVNVDESRGVAAQLGIRSIPTVMLFEGGELQGVLVGLHRKADFDQLIDGAPGEPATARA